MEKKSYRDDYDCMKKPSELCSDGARHQHLTKTNKKKSIEGDYKTVTKRLYKILIRFLMEKVHLPSLRINTTLIKGC